LLIAPKKIKDDDRKIIVFYGETMPCPKIYLLLSKNPEEPFSFLF